MRLNNVKNARASLATLIRKREKDEISDDDYRALVYGLSQLLGFLKAEQEARIEQRLDALEKVTSTLEVVR